MDTNLVPYSPILHRPALRWPNGARIALWVVPNIERYEYQPKYVRVRDPWPRSSIQTCSATPCATTATS